MPSKKPAPKKSAPVKKAAAKKPAPKKAAPAKKPAPAAKKAAPVKKPAAPAKKPAAPAKKVAAKVAPAKKAVPVKKAASDPVSKKPAPAKPVVTKKPVPPTNKSAAVIKKAATPIKAAPVNPAPKPAPVAAKPAPAPVTKPKTEVKLPPAPPVKPVKKPLEPIKEVKVPKITTKTSIPYQPGYTQMEKRTDVSKTSGDPLVRYSDAELNEFRELISRKLEAARKELSYLQGLITRKDEMGGDNDDARYMTMEDGSVSMEREQLGQMASRQITYIDHLEKAAMRIENKTYGVCRVTGKLIDKARLRAVPHATLSLEAKLGLVKPSAEQ
ncbi:MAG: TraR/DksA C4-type zinc finger protein [Chitinophagia bacterium]|jgi:RNA polymerase-binding transcription factor DksA